MILDFLLSVYLHQIQKPTLRDEIAKIIAEILNGNTNLKDLNRIVSENAFAESIRRKCAAVYTDISVTNNVFCKQTCKKDGKKFSHFSCPPLQGKKAPPKEVPQ